MIHQQAKPTERSNWLSIKVTYEDYVLDNSRSKVLKELTALFIDNLYHELSNFGNDALSTEFAQHVPLSEQQAESELWHQLRRIRITASGFKEFTKNQSGAIKKLWNVNMDLSHIPAIKYGIESEPLALAAFAKDHGEVQRCGLFINKTYPMFGASPDGIVGSHLIEIKCPFILKDAEPTDLNGLTKQQKQTFFCELSGSNDLRLKRSHKYYSQVQAQMFVTGFKKCIFIV